MFTVFTVEEYGDESVEVEDNTIEIEVVFKEDLQSVEEFDSLVGMFPFMYPLFKLFHLLAWIKNNVHKSS